MFHKTRLRENVWYLLQLYHLNDETEDNLFLYMDLQLVEKTYMKPYSSEVVYDVITVGYEDDMKESFDGVMTDIYFFEVVQEKIGQIKNFLYYANKSNMGLISYIKESNYDKNYIDLLKKAIIHLNPKFVYKNVKGGLRVGKKEDIILNLDSVKILNRGIKVIHNLIGRDVFANIGGIKTLLPMLVKLSEDNHKVQFV